MRDIKAVDWLTLDDALGRLSREYERAFLTQVGPIALAAAVMVPVVAPAPAPVVEPAPLSAADDVDATLQTLTPAEAASVDELRHGLLQKVKAWLRGEA